MSKFVNKIIYGGGIFFDLCKWIIFAVILLLLIFRFWLSIFIVDGESMEPNLHDKEIVILNNSHYNDRNPERGDIVAVKYPGDPEHKKYVKRVVGLPGDTVSLKDGKVYLNGKQFEEKYIYYNIKTEPSKITLTEWKLSSGEYFLMGDNRAFSNDSRYFGAVEKRFFEGKAIIIVFPRVHLL